MAVYPVVPPAGTCVESAASVSLIGARSTFETVQVFSSPGPIVPWQSADSVVWYPSAVSWLTA